MKMDDTTPPPTSPSSLVTVKEAAAQLRISTMTVYRLVQAGSIPAIRFRRNFRIDQHDLDNFIKNSQI